MNAPLRNTRARRGVGTPRNTNNPAKGMAEKKKCSGDFGFDVRSVTC